MEYDIPASVWKTYYETLSDINEKAAERMLEYIQKHGLMVDKEFIDYAYALTSHYGEAAGELASQMYDYCAEYWTKAATGEKVYKSMKFQPAEPAPTASFSEVAKTMKGIAKSSENPNSYANAVGRMVKQAAEDTTLKNAARDGAEFAWVPNGDTCAFCIMLASNGWKRMSKKALKGGHAEHIHANCDCTYAVRFDGKGGVPGYDPDKYLEIYENAEGNTWKDKLNSMRREDYAENGDKIRAQKKEAYERARRVNYGAESSFESDRGNITARRVDKYGYNEIYVDDSIALNERGLRNINGQVTEAKQILGISDYCDAKVIVTDLGDTLATYNPRTNTMFINKRMSNDAEIVKAQAGYACPLDPRSTAVHEFYHWIDADEYRKSGNVITEADFKSAYIQYRCEIGREMLVHAGIDIDNPIEIRGISDYAQIKWIDNDFDEVYTEFRTKQALEGLQ